jgi:hypothetical protein
MHYAIMKVQTRAALVVLASLTAGCADRGRATRTVEASRLDALHLSRDRRPGSDGRGVDAPLVLITIDGVRWQEVFGGTDPSRTMLRLSGLALLPHLYKLGLERGAFIGAPGYGTMAASGPNYVSLPGYTEILGGRPATSCRSNDCERTRLPTILDEARAAGAKVAAFSSWEPLGLAATSNPGGFHLSCGQGENQAMEPYPGHGSYRPDVATAEAAIAYYQAERPDVFFLGLGDPDEYAHRDDYARYIGSLRQADDILGRFMNLLDHDGERGARTHVIVTADHGRAYDFQSHGSMPEAARVWMAAAGPDFSARGPARSAHERHLADIVPTLRVVLGLPPDPSDSAGNPIEELFPRVHRVKLPEDEELRAASL